MAQPDESKYATPDQKKDTNDLESTSTYNVLHVEQQERASVTAKDAAGTQGVWVRMKKSLELSVSKLSLLDPQPHLYKHSSAAYNAEFNRQRLTPSMKQSDYR